MTCRLRYLRYLLLLAVLLACSGGAWAGTATPRLCPNANPDQTGNNANCAINPVLTFGAQKTSAASIALTVTVNNCQNTQIEDNNSNQLCPGTGNLTLAASSSRVLSGTNSGDFAITGGTCADGTVLTAGQSCTITIVFTPSASAGTTESATLTVTDDGTTSTQTVSLTGTSATVTDVSACGTLSGNTNYRLTADVSSTQSCFLLNGANIDVNGNGHTVTYGSTASSTCVFAFYAGNQSNDSFFSPGRCANGNTQSTVGASNITIHNVTISQGSCLNPDEVLSGGSAAIMMGQGFGDNSSVFNVTFTGVNGGLCSSSSMAIHVDGADGGGWSIHDNVGFSKVVNANRRDKFQGQFFVCVDSGCGTTATQIYNNDLTGGPQGGLQWSGTGGSSFFGNYVAHGNPNASPGWTSTGTGTVKCGGANGVPYTNAAGTTPTNAGTNCTNNFGVSAVSANQIAYQNIISPTQGRGIFLRTDGGSGISLVNNIITSAQEHPNNSEYLGCQLGGAHSLQFDAFGTPGIGPVTATGNFITGIAKDCATSGLRVTDSQNYSNISQNNSYTASRAGGSADDCTGTTMSEAHSCAYAASFDGPGGTSDLLFTSQNDTFTFDSVAIYFDVDGNVRRAMLISPTFIKGSNPSTNYFHFLSTHRAIGAVSSIIIDPVYGSGLTSSVFTNNDILAQDANHRAVSFYEAWTQTITVQNATGGGTPIFGAFVIYGDGHGHPYTCFTPVSGICAPVNGSDFGFPGKSIPPVARRANNDSGANGMDTGYNTYIRSVSVTGCTTSTVSGITVNATNAVTVGLTCVGSVLPPGNLAATAVGATPPYSAVLNWIPSGTPSVTYNIYRVGATGYSCPTSGTWPLIGSGSTSTTFTDTSVGPGFWCYEITAVSGTESPSDTPVAIVVPPQQVVY